MQHFDTLLQMAFYGLAGLGIFIGTYQRGKGNPNATAPPPQPANSGATAAIAAHVVGHPDDVRVIADQARQLMLLKEQLEEVQQQNQALYQINAYQRYMRPHNVPRAWENIISGGPSVLVVEDSGTDAEILIKAFEQSGLINEVVLARDAREALDFLFGEGRYAQRDLSRQPELILLDLKLPGIDGMEVLKRVRDDTRTENIPVIVLTGSKSERDMMASMEIGVDGFIHKSANFDFGQFIHLMTTIGMQLLILRAAWREAHPARLDSEVKANASPKE